MRVVAHVAGQGHVRLPAPGGGVGQFARIEAEQLGQRARLGVTRGALALLPLGDVVGRQAAAGGQGGGVEAGSARRLAEDVAEIVFEHRGSLCPRGSRVRPDPGPS